MTNVPEMKKGEIRMFHGKEPCYKDSFMEYGSPYKILEVGERGVYVEFVRGKSKEPDKTYFSFDTFYYDNKDFELCDLRLISELASAVSASRIKLMNSRNFIKYLLGNVSDAEMQAIEKGEFYGESLCDLLHKHHVDCEVCKEMLEAHNATIITFIITLNEQLKRLEVENKKLKDSILCDTNEQADPEIEEVIE